MRLDEWRSQENLVLWAHELFTHPNWALLKSVMAEEHPKNYVKPAATNAERELGVIYGYDQYENNMNAAAVPALSGELPQATFEPEGKENAD